MNAFAVIILIEDVHEHFATAITVKIAYWIGPDGVYGEPPINALL